MKIYISDRDKNEILGGLYCNYEYETIEELIDRIRWHIEWYMKYNRKDLKIKIKL